MTSGPSFFENPEYPWLGMDTEAVSRDLLRHYHLTLGRSRAVCGEHYLYQAAALTVRDRLVERWRKTRDEQERSGQRRVAYLSLEYLLGRMLSNAVLNLDLEYPMAEALTRIGCHMEAVIEQERDPGLGNGGLGRLAACFLDSCATLGLPVIGYGIRYDYGIFLQQIRDGYQMEVPDHWLEGGTPWEIVAPEHTRRVRFGGHTRAWTDDQGRFRVQWHSSSDVLAVPHDVPVPGYRNGVVNTLRLWKADTSEKLALDDFNQGDHADAMSSQNAATQISMVLYPNDASMNGKILRLRQQYFLSSASLQDVIAVWVEEHGKDFSAFAAAHRFQLNDTHPAVAVAELMRLLLDEYLLDWDMAWAITVETMAYTNHTLLPEALERWPVSMFRELLPRLLEIIYEINHHFLIEVAAHWPGEPQRLRDLSIIEEGSEPMIRMAYLAIVGSSSVNGVAALHTDLLKQGLFRDFHALWPHKFNNKTNGVTPRRWLAFCNPGLRRLLDSTLGAGWVTDLDKLEGLKAHVDDPPFREAWRAVKLDNKARLAKLVAARCAVQFDTSMLFDVQVKRIHEYKRQLLNILHVMHLYDRILRGDVTDMTPRCVLLGGKAAPGYAMAKLIIKLANNVAEVINADARARPLLRMAFLPNYSVSAMEVICAGTDLSEQVSTAGKEASGTGNMKFMMNGALTIGTLDGANIEIRDTVGEENFFLFGMDAATVDKVKANYHPSAIIAQDADLSRVMTMLETDRFCSDEPGLFTSLAESIRSPYDPWLTAGDFRSFVNAQEYAASCYRDSERWTTMSILNTACSGRFSSDRTIREYARDIWQLHEDVAAGASLRKGNRR